MPIFEYVCQECNHTFEELVLKEEEGPSRCPACGKPQVTRVLSAGSFRPHGIPRGSGGFKLPKCAKQSGN